MIVPLAMTLCFSFLRYNLLMPGTAELVGFLQLPLLPHRPGLLRPRCINTLILVGGVLLITVVGGTLLALLLDQPIFGQGIVRILVIAPFFVMPTVVGAGLEEHDDAPGLRRVRLDRASRSACSRSTGSRSCRCSRSSSSSPGNGCRSRR